jgi:redox-sensitive bicupin YhaK (pirin superfamily)
MMAKKGRHTMITVRPSSERGQGQYGWLDTRHTFSFNNYHDFKHTSFRVLRVMNEDWIAPGQGFGTHGHRDMEIVTYVLEGAVAHKDSLGNGSVLRPGEFQRMTAGTGIEHSEFNPSESEPAHLYQIWLFPERRGLTPSYDQRAFPEVERQGKLRVVASPDGRDGSLTIHQDAEIFLATLDAGNDVAHKLAPGRHAWVQVLRGAVTLQDVSLSVGDGAAVSDQSLVALKAAQPAEVMVFDLP